MGLRSASSAIEYLKVLPLEWSSVSRKGNFLSLENTKQFIFKFKSEWFFPVRSSLRGRRTSFHSDADS